MTFTKSILLYLMTVPLFFLIDLAWLGIIAKQFYRDQLGSLMRVSPNWPVAILFYLLFIVGILVFAVIPALNAGSISKALIYGALFGFFTYMTYELTNYAVIKDWPALLVPVDILWGVVLSTGVAAGSYYLGHWFLMK